MVPRGTGIVKPAMVVQVLTVLINALLAPILIAGWLTDAPLGVAGARLATSIAIALGVAMMGYYFVRLEKAVALEVSPRGALATMESRTRGANRLNTAPAGHAGVRGEEGAERRARQPSPLADLAGDGGDGDFEDGPGEIDADLYH